MGPGHTVSRGRTPVSMQAAHTTFHRCMSPRVRREEIGRRLARLAVGEFLFAPGIESSQACAICYKARGREFAVRTMEWEGQKGTGVWPPRPCAHLRSREAGGCRPRRAPPGEAQGCVARWEWQGRRRGRRAGRAGGRRCVALASAGCGSTIGGPLPSRLLLWSLRSTPANPSGPRPSGMGTRSSSCGAPQRGYVTWRHSMPHPVFLPLLKQLLEAGSPEQRVPSGR